MLLVIDEERQRKRDRKRWRVTAWHNTTSLFISNCKNDAPKPISLAAGARAREGPKCVSSVKTLPLIGGIFIVILNT